MKIYKILCLLLIVVLINCSAGFSLIIVNTTDNNDNKTDNKVNQTVYGAKVI